MHKIIFHKVIKSFMLFGIVSAMTIGTNAKAGSVNINQGPDTVTRILTEKPLKPSDTISKYNLSLTETVLKSKNHSSKSAGKTTEDVKSLSLSVEESDQWQWGVNYLYSTMKWHGVEDDRVEYSDSHDVIPYAMHFFTSDAYVMVLGGGRYSSVKVHQNAGTPATGKNKVTAGILGVEVGLEKEFDLWNPSLNAGVLYENERTSKYTLSDGDFTRKQWKHFLQGSVAAQLNVNVHDNFQPYVKTGYQSILRRSSSYTIQKWHGWSLGGGVNLFSAEKWNTALDYEYGYSPKGERQSACMLKLAVSF